MNISVTLTLIGGLGLFLYGMRMMSEGLQVAAGAKMRSVLETLTKTRFRGLLAGALFTAVIQSSSAATVMAVSFVNARLLNLSEALGVIMGANIGTTITSVLISFKLDAVAPLFVFLGILLVMFSKSQNAKHTGDIILGFGILFMGLGSMSSAMNAMKDSTVVMSLLGDLRNPIIAIIVGLVLTALVQSSSAVVGVIQVAAFNDMLELPIILFMLIGCNIGACTSAMISSIGAKKDAKRAAYLHLLINIFGCLIPFIVLLFFDNQIADLFIKMSGSNPMRQVSNAHVIFRLIEIALIYPFSGMLIKLTKKIVPGEDPVNDRGHVLLYINNLDRLAPTAILPNIIQEIERMGRMAIDNLKDSIDALFSLDRKKINQIYQTEAYIDFLDRQISHALRISNQRDLPLSDRNVIGGLFHVVSDIERVGDHAENIADSANICADEDIRFSKKAVSELTNMLEASCKCFDYALDTFTNKTEEHLGDIKALEDLVDDMEIKYSDNHIHRLAKGKCTSEAGLIFNDLLSGLERVSDHATNIAFAIYDPTVEKYFVSDSTIPDSEDEDLEENDELFKERIEKMRELPDNNIHEDIDKNINSKIVASSSDLTKQALKESEKIAKNATKRIEEKLKELKKD